jgi:putative transposase
LATRLGRDGIQGIATLGWRMAAASRPDVWRMYADRFRTPLEAEGEFGAELQTAVLAWLEHQQSVNKAAAAINVHANTLRYRLRRYADITGCDLGDADDVMGVTWALELDHPDR